MTNQGLRGGLVVLALIALVFGPAWGKRKTEDPGPHPIRVLKAKVDGLRRANMGTQSGTITIWLQNTADVIVDGVSVEVEFYSPQGRLIDSFKKEVGEIEGGTKTYADLKWNVVGEDGSLKPKIWIFYNGGGSEPKKFIGEPPVW